MKSSVKNKVNFGLVNRFKGTKLGKWLVKVKLFFIRSVANSKNPPLCDKSDVIDSQIFILDEYYNLTIEILKKTGKIEKSTIQQFLIYLVKIDHFTGSNSIEFIKNHYDSIINNQQRK
jgi:hypothetical protein